MTTYGPYAALDHLFAVDVVNGSDPELEALFDPLLAPGATPAVTYALGLPKDGEDGWLEPAEATDRVEKAELGALHERLLRAVQTAALDALVDPVVHGCLVERGGRGLLLAGSGGRGKSTLSARLLADGGALITEDLMAVGPSGVRPYPRPVALSARSLEALGRPVPEDDCGCGCMKHTLHARDLGGVIGAPRRIDALVLCDATSDQVVELGLPRALGHLFDEAAIGNVEHPEALVRIAAVLAGARCISLGTADLEAAVATLDRLVGDGAAEAPAVEVAAERVGDGSALYLDGEALIHIDGRVHHLDPAATAVWVLHTDGLTDEEVAAELEVPLELVAGTLATFHELELPAPTP